LVIIMASETVVLDSNNLAAIIQDATGEPLEQPKAEGEPETKVEAKETKPEAKPAKPAADPDGLTEDERKTYTEKMRKSVAWRHGKMREAQEEAQREKQGRLAAEECAKAVQQELEQLRSQPKVEPLSSGPKEPQPQDFQTTEAYMAARVKWEVGQELAKERVERQKAEQQAEIERITDAARKRIAKAIELVPDYAEVTGTVDLPVPGHIAGYMQESELFAELGYFFAQHPDELERLSKMRPANSLVALGKIESTLQPFGELSPKAEANGASPKPSTAADGTPSRPRVSVPVIQPLTARGAPEVATSETTQNGRQAVTTFEKRTGTNLSRRSRH
jgi:hypothetical protein